MSAAPNQNNAAQADTKDIRESFELSYATDADDPACAADLFHFTNGWRACVMSQVRAPVARNTGELSQFERGFAAGWDQCVASVPVAKEAQPAAYLTLDEEGSPCMLFFDAVEARSYCALGEVPEPLFRHAAPQASAEARPNKDAVDMARAGMALHAPGAPEHMVCADLVRLADVLKQPEADNDAAPCTCPSSDGSLRHPCAEHPQAEACKKEV